MNTNQTVSYSKRAAVTLLTVMSMIFAPTQALAEEVTIGSLVGAQNDSYLPMNSLWNYSYSQQIYTADEIGMAGTINAITLWLYGNMDLYEMPFDIYMIEVEKDAFDGKSDWVTVTQSDIVYSGSVTVHNAEAQAYTFDLDKPFVYSGENNLLIAFNNKTGSWKSGLNGKVFESSDQAKRTLHARQDGAAYAPTNPTFTAYELKDSRNVIELSITPTGSEPCEKPASFTVSDETAHTATLTWSGGSGTYNVEYKKASDENWTTDPSLSNMTLTTATLANLASGTPYQARVQSVSDGNNTSRWVTVSFTTDCEAVTTFPWSEDFEGYASGMLDDLCWVNEHISGEGNSLFTVLSSTIGDNGTQKLHLPDQKAGTLTKLRLPAMTLPDNGYEFAIDVYRSSRTYGNNYQTEGIRVYVSANGEIEGATELAFIPRHYQVSNQVIPAENAEGWYNYELPIPMSGHCYIILRGESQYSTATYMDNLAVKEAPSCMAPGSLTVSAPYAHGATLNWTLKDNTQSVWDVEVATNKDFTEGITLIKSVDSHENYVLSGLNPETTYYVHVRANCGSGNVSDWSKTVTFTTPVACPKPTRLTVKPSNHSATLTWTGASDSYTVSYRNPYANGIYEQFNSSGIPAGWTSYSGLVNDIMAGNANLGSSSSWYTTSNALGQYNLKLNIYGTYRNDWIVTPAFTLSQGQNLSFDMALTDYYNANPIKDNTAQQDDRFVVLIYADNEWHILREWNNSGSPDVFNNISNESQDVKISLNAYYGKNVKIAFYGESTQDGGDNDLHIDNVICGTSQEVAWQSINVNETTATITGLTPETIYEAKVQGDCGEDGMSDESDVISFTTLVAYPAPTGLAATLTPGDGTKATLSWTETGDATTWQICLNDDETSLINATENPYTLTGLTADAFYTAKVRAAGDEGHSTWSSPVSFEPTAKTIIGSGTATFSFLPSGSYYKHSLSQQIYTTAELGEAGIIESIDFYHTYNSNTRNIDVYMVSTDKDEFTSKTDWIPVTEADLVFSGVVTFALNKWTSINFTNPFTYDGTHNVAIIVDDNTGSYESTSFYRVFTAANNKKQSIYYRNDDINYDPTGTPGEASDITSSKNQIRVGKSNLSGCMMPTRLTSTVTGPDFATLSWVENGTATAWVVAYKAKGQTNFTTQDASSNPFTLSGLASETEYSVKVRPACDESKWSSELTFTTLKANPAPTGVIVSPTTLSATISWTGYGDSYQIRYRKQDNGSNSEWLTATTNETSATLTGLEALTAYEYQVQSVKEGKENSDWTVLATFTTLDIIRYPLTGNYVLFFEHYMEGDGLELSREITSAVEGQKVIVSLYPENIPEDQYMTGAFLSDDVEITAGENTDGVFAMPAKAVTVNAQFATRSAEYVIDLTTNQQQTIPEDVYLTLMQLEGYSVHDETIQSTCVDLNRDGKPDLQLTENEDEVTETRTYGVKKLAGAADVTVNSRFTILTFEFMNHSPYLTMFIKLDDSFSEQLMPVLETLLDEYDNSSDIARWAGDGEPHNIMIEGRTLRRDGSWNTLCLPFDVTISSSVLDGAEARPLSSASISDKTLNVSFGNTVDELEAGVPYIIRWNEAAPDIVDPTFMGVTFPGIAAQSYDSSAKGVTTAERVRFSGQYSPTTYVDYIPDPDVIGQENYKNYLLLDGNELYYPEPTLADPTKEWESDINPKTFHTLGAFHSCFKIGNDGAVQTIRPNAYSINFGNGNVITGRIADKGDVNGDGQITITDATLVMEYLSTGTMPEGFVLRAADTNGDGQVTYLDAVSILNMLLTQQ